MFTAIIQPKGLLHRFIRSKDTSTIVERPERLRAVAVGVAVAAARLEELLGPPSSHKPSTYDSNSKIESTEDSLTDALDRLAISSEPGASAGGRATPFNIMDASPVTLDLLNNPALEFVHGEATDYLSKIVSWAAESENKIKVGESEIPTGFSQGDLYLCPQSIEAIAGAASAMCEAVDMSIGHGPLRPKPEGLPTRVKEEPTSSLSNSSLAVDMNPLVIHASEIPLPPSPKPAPHAIPTNTPRVFVAARPPGHHCSDEVPSGFCFVNNVMIGAAHAHLKYGVKRLIVLDFDLHHGNGTQAIAWSINTETMRQREENDAKVAAGLPPSPTGPQVYYASLHDILSFPCEDGEPALIQAASTTLSGAHGQYIENVHLEPYTSEDDFFGRLYPVYQEKLLGGAARFLASTQQFSSSPEETMVFVSAGFDASPHEYEYMSRHNRNVPTAFYTRFARDVVAFAENHAMGRVVSVLEGGYSDWGLMSASAAYVSGLAVPEKAEEIVNRRWWEPDSLEQLERLVKPVARGAKPRLSKTSAAAVASEPTWMQRTRELTETMDRELFTALPPLPNLRAARPPRQSAPTSSAPKMTLRDRTKREPGGGPGTTPGSSPPNGSSRATTSAVTEASTRVATPQSPPRKPRGTRTPASSPPKSKPTTTSSRPPVSSASTAPKSTAKPVSKVVRPRVPQAPAPSVPRLPHQIPSPTSSPPAAPFSAPTTPTITPAAEILAAPPNSAPPKPIGRPPQEQETLKIRIRIPSRARSPIADQTGPSPSSEPTLPDLPPTTSSL